jgi:hypothetical protein
MELDGEHAWRARQTILLSYARLTGFADLMLRGSRQVTQQDPFAASCRRLSHPAMPRDARTHYCHAPSTTGNSVEQDPLTPNDGN